MDSDGKVGAWVGGGGRGRGGGEKKGVFDSFPSLFISNFFFFFPSFPPGEIVCGKAPNFPWHLLLCASFRLNFFFPFLLPSTLALREKNQL